MFRNYIKNLPSPFSLTLNKPGRTLLKPVTLERKRSKCFLISFFYLQPSLVNIFGIVKARLSNSQFLSSKSWLKSKIAQPWFIIPYFQVKTNASGEMLITNLPSHKHQQAFLYTSLLVTYKHLLNNFCPPFIWFWKYVSIFCICSLSFHSVPLSSISAISFSVGVV